MLGSRVGVDWGILLKKREAVSDYALFLLVGMIYSFGWAGGGGVMVTWGCSSAGID